VHLKAARAEPGRAVASRSRAFSIQHDLDALPRALCDLHCELGGRPGDLHAVTMTAELSQRFRLKRDGVSAVLDALLAAFPGATIRVFSVDGRFLDPETARREPIVVAASNWAATAWLVARDHPDAVLIDIGSTTTDIIPIEGGRVAARGATDPDRLRHDELVYTGAVRTPVEAVVTTVPWRGGATGVSADGFATTGDVHVWLGHLAPDDYATPTPDGRPVTRAFAGERLARVICGDRSLVSDAELDAIAAAVAAAQVARIAEAVRRVRERHPAIRQAVITGLGEWLARKAAERTGLEVVSLARTLGDSAARVAPAVAVAMLAIGMEKGPAVVATQKAQEPGTGPAPGVLMIKVGGGVSRAPGALERVARVLTALASTRRILIFPGGGPFADRVREFDRGEGLSPDAAHWMAILAMDQYARVLADRIPAAEIVTDQPGMETVHARGGIPVLAPARWLMAADEVPHTWEVTSDSLAAYLATLLGLEELLLIKPVAGGIELLDPYFPRVTPAGLRWEIVPLDGIEGLLPADRPRTGPGPGAA
jgi:(4-(4-[2-(gamma-L-glutamylamino)ethyl]phenoxymethyl)furan-2-yl)methanamine synthase